ncbi:PHA/PHB synthase family protein [Noviherbaspirillum pedocola]|uniref:PHA/PHB synthase family protein n=1 Tax=Noviherbaspirillum pedocola TaxID=2801341 RepID=UPI0038990E38
MPLHHPPEREASAWLGKPHHVPSAPQRAVDDIDRLLHALFGRLFYNISPASMAMAFFDWWVHLAISPSRQQELAYEAFNREMRMALYGLNALLSPQHAPPAPVVPLPQDKRFSDPSWERWPFNLIYQSFLLNQQWWHRASSGLRGVSPHHEDVVTFTLRQWLDTVAPSNFVATNPVVLQKTMQTGGANLVSGAAALWSDLMRNASGARPPASEHFRVGENVAITPGKVVLRNRLMELIQYSPATQETHAVPLLIVPAWIMKYYILDLSPENSLVRYLVDAGYTVFMISWKNPDAGDRDLGMEDYRRLGVMSAIHEIQRITGAEKVNAVGYCLGGTLLSIAAAAMAREGDDRLNSISLFASQVDFKEPGELSLFIDDSQVALMESMMWQQGYLDTTQMAGAFHLLRSNDLIWSRLLNQYLLGQPDPQNDLMAWNADATRMPYRMHSEYLRHLFLGNDLAEGRYLVDGKPIALSDIRAPIFSVGTVTDHVAPWRSAFKIHLATDTEVTFLLTSGGHNAGVVSPPGKANRQYQIATRAPQDAYIDPETWLETVPEQPGSWWPAWEAWLGVHSGPMGAPPEMGRALEKAPGRYVMQP